MWKVLPKLGLIKFLTFLFTILLLSWVLILLGDSDFVVDLGGSHFFSAIKTSGVVSLFFIGITWLLAKWVWVPFWRIRWLGADILNKVVCPDLNGMWRGQIVSVYKDDAGDQTIKEVEMEIKGDFLSFDIRLKSKDNYQRSTVVQSEIFKDARDGIFYVSYIFESVVDQPKPTDDSKFDGAAKLAVRFDGDRCDLVGTYWTNRAWQRGDNTAGTINLSRVNTS
jgi:hypothetical protein